MANSFILAHIVLQEAEISRMTSQIQQTPSQGGNFRKLDRLMFAQWYA
jgi:hypothetical protein